MEGHKSARLGAADLPPECWVLIASFLPPQERVSLAIVSKQLYDATRCRGDSLWQDMSFSFASAATLHSFAAWLRHCCCAPHRLTLQHADWQVDQLQPSWEEVVAVLQTMLPSLRQLIVRWEGEAVAGDWMLGATHLEDLGLYCRVLTLQDALGSLTHLKDLSLESSQSPIVLESAATLPPSLTKLFTVDSHMAEVPEALSRVTALQCAYLSRNPLSPPSLARLAALPRLELLSLIGCWFDRPPPQLSALTSLRALYLDYNSSLGNANEDDMQAAFTEALGPLVRLQALGLSHNFLDSFPESIAGLTRLRVLYLESNPGIARLPPSAEAVLGRLRTLSCDSSVLFSNAGMMQTAAGQLEHLFVSGSGLMWHVMPAVEPADVVLDALVGMRGLKRVTFVVQTQKEEVPSVDVAALMLQLPRRCPNLAVDALDSELFYGVTLQDLDELE